MAKKRRRVKRPAKKERPRVVTPQMAADFQRVALGSQQGLHALNQLIAYLERKGEAYRAEDYDGWERWYALGVTHGLHDAINGADSVRNSLFLTLWTGDPSVAMQEGGGDGDA